MIRENQIQKSKLKISRELLYKLYIVDGLSLRKIEKTVEIDRKILSKVLIAYGIEKREQNYCYHKIRISEEVLRKKYLDERKSASTIAKELKTTRTVIYNRMCQYKIERRSLSESRKGMRNSPATEFKKGHKITWVGTPKENEIREKASAAKRGSKNPMWQGGIQNRVDAMEFRKIRKVVLERDGHRCQLCGGNDKQLYVHHMIPYRISPRDELENLISLCSQCHTEAEMYYRRHPDSYMDIYYTKWGKPLELKDCFFKNPL